MPRNGGTRMGTNSLEDSSPTNKETEPAEKLQYDSLQDSNFGGDDGVVVMLDGKEQRYQTIQTDSMYVTGAEKGNRKKTEPGDKRQYRRPHKSTSRNKQVPDWDQRLHFKPKGFSASIF